MHRASAMVWRSRPPLSMHPSSVISRCLWMGNSESKTISYASSRVQRRDYVFLPASFSDAFKQLKLIFDSSEKPRQRLMVKVQNRWQDTLFNFQKRIRLLKQNQRQQREYARQRTHAARISMMKKSAKYSLFVTNMRGSVGQISSTVLSRGKRNLLFHYNAKKRVYARKRIAKFLTKKMGGNKNFIERWKMKHGLDNNSGLGWMNDGSLSKSTWRGITLNEPAQHSWFDAEGFPLTSRDPETGRFLNPWLSESTNGELGLWKFLKWRFSRLIKSVGSPADAMVEKNGRVPRERSLKGPLLPWSYPSISSTKCPPPVGEQERERIRLTWVSLCNYQKNINSKLNPLSTCFLRWDIRVLS